MEGQTKDNSYKTDMHRSFIADKGGITESDTRQDDCGVDMEEASRPDQELIY